MNYKLKKDIPGLKAGAVFIHDDGSYNGPDDFHFYADQVENNPEWFEPIPDTVTMPVEQYDSMMNDLKSATERRKAADEYIKNLETQLAAIKKEKQRLEGDLSKQHTYHNDYSVRTNKENVDLRSKLLKAEAHLFDANNKISELEFICNARSKRIEALEKDLYQLRNTSDSVSIGFPYNPSELASNCKVEVPSGYVLIQDGKHVKWSDDDMLDFAKYICISTDTDHLESILTHYATNKQHRH